MNEPPSRTSGQPIAIIAMGAMFPGRGTTHGFFRDLIEGVDTISEVPDTHWRIDDYYDEDPTAPDKTYGRRGGFLSPQAFDPARFGIPPKALSSTDTVQLLALLVSDRVMADVEAATQSPVNRERTSVVLGVASATELTGHMAARLQRPVWERTLRESGFPEDMVVTLADRMSANYTGWTEATFPGLLGNVVAGRIANRLDLGGSNFVTDAACASSLSALHVAVQELRAGSADMAFAGGADALNDILMYLCFSKTPALSHTGDCRPFSSAADGTILGEGIGMVALKRLCDAERDGDRIHAVIRGIGGSSDGRATAIYAPLSSGQARALRRAYADAGYGPETVELVEAHGTGTMAGDRAEIEGLAGVFERSAKATAPWCALGSVKSQIGHTKAAAGAASLVKVAMALNRRVIPPTIKIDKPAAALTDSSAFYTPTIARPWVKKLDTPRRASVSSFGFGGSNFHATLEAYEGPNRALPARIWPAELLLFSAENDAELASRIEGFSQQCSADEAIPAMAETLSHAFNATAPVRAFVLCRDLADLKRLSDRILPALRSDAADETPWPQGSGYCRRAASDAGKLAYLFSGQGSQYVGMGAELAIAMPPALDIWSEAVSLPATASLALHDKAFPPRNIHSEDLAAAEQQLKQMTAAQPAIAATAMAQLDILALASVKPDMVGGHSFGEVVALYAAGVLSRQQALSVASARAEAMTEAASEADGGMLAVSASADDVQGLLKNHPDLVLANDNGPSQIAVSGPQASIDRLDVELKQSGYTCRILPVASAFHSAIVAPAVEPFRAALDGVRFNSPSVPVYANATARRYPSKPENMRMLLANQIRQTVRFREMVLQMHKDGARTFIEVGPGSVLSGLTRSILDGLDVTITSLDHKRMDSPAMLLSAIGTLAIKGHAVNTSLLYRAMPAPPEPAPAGKFSVPINGANYGKPSVSGAPIPEPQQSSMKSPPDINPSFRSKAITMTSPRQPPEDTIQRAIADLGETHRLYLSTVAGLLGNTQTTSTALRPAEMASTPLNSGAMASTAAATPAARIDSPSDASAVPVSPVKAPNRAPAKQPAEETGPGITVEAIKSVIAEATGYPEAMLDADMHLEAELGIDSIKQVEILSTLKERFPALPAIDPDHLNEINTISGIAEYLGGRAPASGIAPNGSAPRGKSPEFANALPQPEPFTLPQSTAASPVPAPTPTAPPEQKPAASNMATTIKTIIAEATGYPEDMLDDDMDLEAELGIDSIKQVEILSTLKEQNPGIRQVDPDDMATLRTIADLAAFFQ